MPAKSGGAPANAGSAPGQVRIIGGALRRSVLPVLAVQGLRPTADRIRETLFNWLGQSLPPIAVLDAFAGTGALGLEALSRGAGQVDLFETHAAVRRQLQDNVALMLTRLRALQLTHSTATVRGEDVCAHLKSLAATTNGFRYDLALLDPPFQSDWLIRALPLVMACMKAEGRIYVEWHAPLSEDAPLLDCVTRGGWTLERQQRAGRVHFHLLARAS